MIDSHGNFATNLFVSKNQKIMKQLTLAIVLFGCTINLFSQNTQDSIRICFDSGLELPVYQYSEFVDHIFDGSRTIDTYGYSSGTHRVELSINSEWQGEYSTYFYMRDTASYGNGYRVPATLLDMVKPTGRVDAVDSLNLPGVKAGETFRIGTGDGCKNTDFIEPLRKFDGYNVVIGQDTGYVIDYMVLDQKISFQSFHLSCNVIWMQFPLSEIGNQFLHGTGGFDFRCAKEGNPSGKGTVFFDPRTGRGVFTIEGGKKINFKLIPEHRF